MLREFGVALAAGAVALTLTACGGAEEAPEPDTQEASTDSAGSESIFDRIRNLVEDTQQVDSYRARVTGVSGGVPLDMEIAYVSSPEPTVEMVMDTPEGAMTILVRGSEMLMGSAEEGWLRLDAGEEVIPQGSMQDPFEELDHLLASDDVQEEGTEEINGVPTTRYTGTYSVEEAGLREVPFTLWVREDGLPQRYRFTGFEGAEMTMDFLEFNSEVSVEFPSDDQILDLSDLEALQGLGELAGAGA